MTKNPVYNALFAILYIVVLVTAVNVAATHLQMMPDNLFMPMSVLATLVLSVALMAYVFFYQPVMLFLDGHREEGVKLFLKSVGFFAVATAIVLLVAFLIGARHQPVPMQAVTPVTTGPAVSIPVEDSNHE